MTHIERVGLEEIHLTTPQETYKLRLPVGEPPSTMQRWFDQIVVKIDGMGYAPPPPSELVGGLDDDELTKHDHPPWWKMPHDPSCMTQVIFYSTFILKAMVFTTTPNVLITSKDMGGSSYHPATGSVPVPLFVVPLTEDAGGVVVWDERATHEQCVRFTQPRLLSQLSFELRSARGAVLEPSLNWSMTLAYS